MNHENVKSPRPASLTSIQKKKPIRNQQPKNEKKEGILTRTIKTIEECLTISINQSKYGIKISKSMRKMASEAVTISAIVYLLDDAEKQKILLFVVDRDKVTSMVHVTIIDNNSKSPNILFVTNDENPISKMEKYIPNIINSTEKMIN